MKKLGCMIFFILAMLIGEIRCVYKALTCNWEPIGKAEVIYTASSLTGLGCFIGWLNIEDK